MSISAVGGARGPYSLKIPILEPIAEEQVDQIFATCENDAYARYNFMKQWGLINVNQSRYEGQGNFGTVVRTRYSYIVAKCFTDLRQCRALREAKTLVLLHKENIPYTPSLYAVSPYRDGPLLIMNHAGKDLSHHYENGSLQLNDISVVALQVLRCLQSLAEKGITHNDIKPRNICYDRLLLHTTLIDWEGASTSRYGKPEVARVVTSKYLPPERCLKLQAANDVERCKTDVWAVAVTIFRVLAMDGALINDSAGESRLTFLHALEQRIGPLPQKMIDESPLKNELTTNNRLHNCAITLHLPIIDAFENGKKKAGEHFIPYNKSQYNKLSCLVLDLLKIDPAERPTAAEALEKHFPSQA